MPCVHLIVEPLPGLLHEDGVPPIHTRQTGGAHLFEDGTIGLPMQTRIAVLTPDMSRLRDPVARLHGLAGGPPERRSKRHGRELSIRSLRGVWLACHLILLGQSGVEHAPKVHVARMAPRRDNHSLGPPDPHRLTFMDRRQPHDPSRGGVLNELRHLMEQQDLGTFGPGALLQRPDEPGPAPGLNRRDQLLVNGPLKSPPISRVTSCHLVLKTDAVFDHPLEGLGAQVRVHPSEIPVRVSGLIRLRTYPILKHGVR